MSAPRTRCTLPAGHGRSVYFRLLRLGPDCDSAADNVVVFTIYHAAHINTAPCSASIYPTSTRLVTHNAGTAGHGLHTILTAGPTAYLCNPWANNGITDDSCNTPLRAVATAILPVVQIPAAEDTIAKYTFLSAQTLAKTFVIPNADFLDVGEGFLVRRPHLAFALQKVVPAVLRATNLYWAY